MSRALDRLYRQIPAMKCIAGCTDCCGPVPSSAEERARAPLLPTPRQGIEAALEALTSGGCASCPYSSDAGCEIYDSRPFMCRLFGTAPDEPRLRCPHGCEPAEPLTKREAARLTLRYMRLMNDAALAARGGREEAK